jgi:chaperone modulatory protein CbpM
MTKKTLSGILLDEHADLSLNDLCRACSQHEEWVIELVEEGVLEPIGNDYKEWAFPAASLQRARAATRLQRDLSINLTGIALALDLMDEIERLRARLNRFGIKGDT